MMIVRMSKILLHLVPPFLRCCLALVGLAQSGSWRPILGSGQLCSHLSFLAHRFLLPLGSGALCRPGWGQSSWMWASQVVGCRRVVVCFLGSRLTLVLICTHLLLVVMMGVFFVGRLLLN